MPRKRAKVKNRIEKPAPWLIQYLTFGEIPGSKQEGVLECFQLRGNRQNEKKIWKKYHDLILSSWLQNRPGTRPFAWWKFEASEPRKQVSGKGVLVREKFPAIVPRFTFGVPCDWYQVNEDNPPMFESEATYLKRHGLLTKSEEKRLSDFEPEPCLKYIKTYDY